jgi:hypothetical protein
MEHSLEMDLKPVAFRRISQPQNDNLEDVINDNLSNDSRPYDDMDFLLAREQSKEIREDNAVKMLTVNIIQTYKKCKNDFSFEETMKPRRELTIPNEGENF